MYEMFVSVQDVSWDTPGMMSKRIFRQIIRTTCIVQAPTLSHFHVSRLLSMVLSNAERIVDVWAALSQRIPNFLLNIRGV